MTLDIIELTRRGFLQGTVVGGGAALLSGAETLVPTDPDDEGPFYKPDAPFREQIFRESATGVPLEVTGRVLSATGETIPGAIVDVWNATPEGQYDMNGFHLRGRVKADSKGRYRFVTIQPSGYGSRAPHLHFRISGPAHRLLTTQLYFKGESRNLRDSFVRPSRIVAVRDAGARRSAEFTFVLAGT